MLIAVSDLCGELDCMFALAQGANQYHLVRPRMTEENVIDIKDCRHLLQEMTVPSYVANDAYLVGGRGSDHVEHEDDSSPDRSATLSSASDPESEPPGPSVLLLTGPNYSGKSIYLKSIAQCIYLSHLGSFVPCTRALIGLTPIILTRIRTCETVSRPHSAFMIDLQQVATMLQMATRRALVVVDEFGKGTDGCDGAGLVAGVFRHLLGRGQETPKVLAATHFHEIFEVEGGLDPRDRGLALAHMEVRVDPRFRDDGSVDESALGTEVIYLYKLRPDRSSESFGTQCAAMNGVPATVVERASLLSRLAVKGEDLVRVCAGVGGREEEEEMASAERMARGFLEWDLDPEGDGEGEGGVEDLRGLLEGLLGEEGSGMSMGTANGTGNGNETEMTTETWTETGTGSGTRS
jgi:DNA mismatch repair protein MSH5